MGQGGEKKERKRKEKKGAHEKLALGIRVHPDVRVQALHGPTRGIDDGRPGGDKGGKGGGGEEVGGKDGGEGGVAA